MIHIRKRTSEVLEEKGMKGLYLAMCVYALTLMHPNGAEADFSDDFED